MIIQHNFSLQICMWTKAASLRKRFPLNFHRHHCQRPSTYGAFFQLFPSFEAFFLFFLLIPFLGSIAFLSFEFNSPLFPPFPRELGRWEFCNRSSLLRLVSWGFWKVCEVCWFFWVACFSWNLGVGNETQLIELVCLRSGGWEFGFLLLCGSEKSACRANFLAVMLMGVNFNSSFLILQVWTRFWRPVTLLGS